jgi:histidine phosphotransfer protein HptB
MSGDREVTAGGETRYDREVAAAPARELDREAQARAAAERLRRFGGQALAHDMIEMFVEDTPLRIATAREGVVQGDAGAVEHAAHSMKGSCAQFGATTMQRLALEVEMLAKRRDLADVAPLLEELVREFAAYRPFIEPEARRPSQS